MIRARCEEGRRANDLDFPRLAFFGESHAGALMCEVPELWKPELWKSGRHNFWFC